ncbi:hypothetical protein E2C01_097335 [Portunus trituberculatus]|uniref:Uncharacterized protein n=1 Tax=Portunus trituberculatus TaxID=210409 RepID=A0A5B7K9N8_PORTR|nr:hypothetical protein [Portunus trituberculatus]
MASLRPPARDHEIGLGSSRPKIRTACSPSDIGGPSPGAGWDGGGADWGGRGRLPIVVFALLPQHVWPLEVWE